MSQDLTEFARTGFYGNDNCHLATSPAWYAHAFGLYLHRNGYHVPEQPHRHVAMSRGDSVRMGDKRFAFTHTSPGVVHFDRIIFD